MAKIRKNIIIQGLSGSLGDQLVIKQDKAGRTIVSASPAFDPNRTFSPAQQEQMEKFRNASAYAKDAKTASVYVEKAEGTAKSSYNVAMADWFHAPEVQEIDASDWSGQANQMIRVQARDNVQVELVKIVITEANGTVLEQGNAVSIGGGWWSYTTQSATPTAARIIASARDLPGNLAELGIDA